ncbi:hypothetical protein FOPG_18649 [Fusarium oxysporum f. sp. conglutinans race 2 54008]|uniref:Uncharacterized protein n=1 Tax=Fusarium oxysporum f. sp. conglutinans race 2 54008 TaxID=1089457 RepID=X0HVB1_FUSOX|nr:hypothetical protein FOPG_18649 [Fusarium oxysporum f. sp. conglutinans race 2 54008]
MVPYRTVQFGNCGIPGVPHQIRSPSHVLLGRIPPLPTQNLYIRRRHQKNASPQGPPHNCHGQILHSRTYQYNPISWTCGA